MDPDKALQMARTAHEALAPLFEDDETLLIRIIDGSIHPDLLGELMGHIGALIDGFGALDSWLSQAGFAPQAWSNVNRRSTRHDTFG